MLEGTKILITGATGQVVRGAAYELAERNEVWCLGRFGDPAVRAELESRGMVLAHWDMANDTALDVPDDFTHVLHAAVLRENYQDFDAAVDVNCLGAAVLMHHCRNAHAFLHVSTTGVYKPLAPDHLNLETDPLGGARGTIHEAYGVGKLAAEGTVRALARVLGLPTTIARMNVAIGPYGHGGVVARFYHSLAAGEPIPIADEPTWCSPIHTDDVARQVPALWDAAAVPAAIVNWCGDEAVSTDDLMAQIADLAGLALTTRVGDSPLRMTAADPTKRRAITGPCRIPWREAVRLAMEAHFPDAVKPRQSL
jgi:nucleoside-diphosphate-sugar epimerase